MSRDDLIARIIGVAAVAFLIWFVFLKGDGSSAPERSSTTTTTTATKHISGKFVEWQPVDEKNGYALFTVTNNGSSAAEAECTVKVSNDFGNFGYDIMSGETIAAGETKNYRMPLSVGEGSFLIDSGEVTDC